MGIIRPFPSPALVIFALAAISSAGAQSFHGITEPFRQSTISATVPGRIASILKDEGDFVKKGAVIIQLEKSEEELEVARRKLIAESTVELQAAKEQVKTLKKDLDATQKLFESTQSVSEEELWKLELEYKRALAEHERLSIQEQREEIEYKMARAQLWKRSVTAPFSGIVVKHHRNEGESCNAQEPLVRIVDTRKCRFVTYVEAAASQGLQERGTVTLKVHGVRPALSVQGIIDYVSPVVDPSSGLREVKVVFDNPDGKVNPGVAAKLIMAGAQ